MLVIRVRDLTQQKRREPIDKDMWREKIVAVVSLWRLTECVVNKPNLSNSKCGFDASKDKIKQDATDTRQAFYGTKPKRASPIQNKTSTVGERVEEKPAVELERKQTTSIKEGLQ